MNETLILLLLLAVLGLPVVLNLRKQQKTIKGMSEVQQQVVPGSRIVTSSGVHGTVVEVGQETVRLELAPGFVTTWERRAIMRIDTAENGGTVTGTTEA